uniref:NADH-ubiquinone oxidoreductase chain 4L n=1 Tax=Cornufer vitianus TaxID=1582976 RepID=A0A0K0LFH5_CORVT|nr:NADH dehydrogenase subunit 4L [Cornufer vitianus]AIZ97084.1 NADH dehydrogenase subunit 4L [Cornufer vitianus]
MTMFVFMFIITFVGLMLHRTHLLSTLLCLEGLMLIIYLNLSLWSQFYLTLMPTSLTVLTLSACEAGLGLALMVATARSQGTDSLKTLNLLRC